MIIINSIILLLYYFIHKNFINAYRGIQPKPIPCRLGFYREPGTSGTSLDECIPCPRGTYGSSEGLTNSKCSGYCPKGTYQDQLAATSINDCLPCPKGVYGDSIGLQSKDCSNPCPDGTYSNHEGLIRENECIDCPPDYRGSQSFRGGDHRTAHPCDTYWKFNERRQKYEILNGKTQLFISKFMEF